jgi:hypothetical protein
MMILIDTMPSHHLARFLFHIPLAVSKRESTRNRKLTGKEKKKEKRKLDESDKIGFLLGVGPPCAVPFLLKSYEIQAIFLESLALVLPVNRNALNKI